MESCFLFAFNCNFRLKLCVEFSVAQHSILKHFCDDITKLHSCNQRVDGSVNSYESPKVSADC